MAARPILGSARFGFSRVFPVQAFLVARRFDRTDPCFSAVACAQSRALRCSLPLPCDARCACRFGPVQAGAGRASRSPAVAASFIRHAIQRLLARRSAARRKALPASGDSDVDPFGNVYFPRRVSTHARLPLRILPRVLRRFARPRSTARNPRKGASRLRRRLSLKALVVQPIRPRSAPCPRGRQRGVSRRAETKTTRKGTEDGEQA